MKFFFFGTFNSRNIFAVSFGLLDQIIRSLGKASVNNTNLEEVSVIRKLSFISESD